MGIVEFIFYMVASYVITSMLAPDMPKVQSDQEKAQTNVDAPTINEGSAVPVIFGTVLTSRQNVSWYGGLSAAAFESDTRRGFKYSLTAQLSQCMGPVGAIREVRFDDLVVPTANYTLVDTTNYWDFVIDAPDLLGGLDQEGGVVGTLRVYKGNTTQTSDLEVTTLVGESLPAFRRVCYAVMRNMYVGTSPRLKALSLLIERLPNSLGLASDHHIISSHRDANAACVLYECFTDTVWGAGTDPADMDLASWQAAGELCFTENLGISLTLSQPQELDALVQQLLGYIDAQVFEDTTTGKLKIRPTRESELVDVPVLTKADITSISVARTLWTELETTAKVTFTDASRNYETGGVMARNSALTRALGGVTDLRSEPMLGFTNAVIAQKAADRIARTVSYPLSKVELTGKRRLAGFEPGSPIRVQWDYPPIDAIFRVANTNIRTLTDGDTILSAIEDIFSTSTNTFTAPPSSGFDPGTGATARPAPLAVLLESPYYLRRNDNRSLIFGASSPSALHTGFKAVVNGVAEVTSNTFLARGTLTAALAQWTGATLSTLTATITLPADVVTPTAPEYDSGDALLLIDSELLAYRTVTVNGDGTVTFGTVARGVLDTTPAAHASTAAVTVLKTLRARVNLDATSDAAQSVGAQTSTLTDTMLLALVPSTTLTTNSRAARPIPPAAVTISGVLWGAGPHASPVTVAWEPRTRLATQVLDQAATGQTAESATDYVLKVYAADGTTLLETIETSSTSTAAITSYGNLVLDLRARRGGLVSYQGQRIPFNIIGPALLTEGSDTIITEASDRLMAE